MKKQKVLFIIAQVLGYWFGNSGGYKPSKYPNQPFYPANGVYYPSNNNGWYGGGYGFYPSGSGTG